MCSLRGCDGCGRTGVCGVGRHGARVDQGQPGDDHQARRARVRDQRGRRAGARHQGLALRAGARLKALATASTAAPAAGIARSSGCVKNKRWRGFVVYAPRYSRAKTDAAEFQYVFHLYKQNNARRRDRRQTKQYEMCAIGGGRAKGGNRLERARSSMAAKTKSSTILGPGDWGKGKEEPSAEASLSFEVPVKPVTISGTLSVHPQDLLTGGQGSDRSKSFGDYSFNQVNGIWQGGSTFVFQGSTNFQGNVAIGLWEYLQASPGPRFAASAGVERHCGRPYGIGCK